MRSRPSPCDAGEAAGRMAKANQFFDAAATIQDLADDQADVGDAYVTLCVHAGIAAADVLCCLSLGEHAVGDNHQDAIALLHRVSPAGSELAKALNSLLGMKTRAGYSASPVTADTRKRAGRAAEKLVSAARERRL